MSKKPRGNIHKIREFELEKIHLIDEFDILQIVGEGWFGKILLVEHRASQTEMVLKAVPKPYVSLRDFYREFHYGLHLGIHRNIVTTYDVAFETAGFYVFTQEYAPLGDLTSNVTDTGVGELYSKRVARQIGSALDYMHAKDIVHRDVKLDNVLIYRSDFTRVKLCDFGESYQAGTVVERRNEWLPYSPPEVLDIKPEGTYSADPNHDVWQFGIVIFVCLTGCLPWQKAATDDPRYVRYCTWHGSLMLHMRRTPKLFKLLTSRAQRMFRRFLEPRADRRPKSLTDLSKFLDDRWLAKTAEKEMAEYETDELCPSMYSFHSSPDEKHRLLYTLADCGLETNVDRQSKKARIKDWIESSVIAEEDEEENEENNSASASSSVSREPVAGHISSIRAANQEAKKEIKTTLKDATQKHFDPRTGALQQGPSEMGVATSKAPTDGSVLGANDSMYGGSLMTVAGSQPDMLASNLSMYNSYMTVNSIGEDNSFDEYGKRYATNHSQSSDNLLMSNLAAAAVGAAPLSLSPSSPTNFMQNSSIGNNATNYGKKITQRSKSDSLKLSMYGSLPQVNNIGQGGASMATSAAATSLFNKNNNTSSIPSNISHPRLAGQQQPLAAAASNGINLLPANSNSSVTFTGLANAFQSLAQISLPANAVSTAPQPAQQTPAATVQSYLPYSKSPSSHEFQVKDSAYGSFDSARSNGVAAATSSSSNRQSNQQPAQKLAQTRSMTVRTQSSQQQRLFHETITSNANSMKDTAYDRVALTNINSNRHR